MKIKRLIETLSKFNPEATVVLNNENGEEVLFAFGSVTGEKVCIGSESSEELTAELSTRFDRVPEASLPQLYCSLLGEGITPDIVSRVLNEGAGEAMQAFCKEHGLM